jgi:DNA-binding MarR family transcriptional regulator
VTLNISAERKTGRSREGSQVERPAPRPLVADVLEELASWNPREFVAAFQRWHHGAISLVHLNVLTLLEAHGPLPMSRLAEALDISVASMTGVIDRMEAKALVQRRRDAEDRRVVLVEPGERGRELFAEIDATRRERLTALLERLSDDELQALLTGHRALRAARRAIATGGKNPTGPTSTAPDA